MIENMQHIKIGSFVSRSQHISAENLRYLSGEPHDMNSAMNLLGASEEIRSSWFWFLLLLLLFGWGHEPCKALLGSLLGKRTNYYLIHQAISMYFAVSELIFHVQDLTLEPMNIGFD